MTAEVLQANPRCDLRHLAYCYGLAPDDAGVRVMVELIRELAERLDTEGAEALGAYVAELGARAAIADANGPGETERILERYATWLHGASDAPELVDRASGPPRTDRVQDTQQAPGATQAIPAPPRPADAPVSSPVSLSGIGTGIVAQVRAALGSGPLSLRSLRVRVGRGWKPVQAAVQGLVAAGEVIRDGERGRYVRLRLVAPHDGAYLAGDTLPDGRQVLEVVDGVPILNRRLYGAAVGA